VKNRSSPACKRYKQRASPSPLSKFIRKEKEAKCKEQRKLPHVSLMRCLKEHANRKRITEVKGEKKREKKEEKKK
jgi:hypothetical protein